MEENLNFLDLFAGAGGLSEGFIQAGYEPIAHVESDSAACFTLRTRMAYHWLANAGQSAIYADYLNGLVSRQELYNAVPPTITQSVLNYEICSETLSNLFHVLDSLLGERKLDLIIGGPPCQAYSLIGRARDKRKMKADRRNYLYWFYAQFLRRYQPNYFVFENVTGLLSATDADGKLHFDAMREVFRETGYETEFKILSCERFGVLQKRKRIVLVGRKGRKSGFFPDPIEWDPGTIVNEVFDDLPPLSAGEGSASPCRLKSYTGSWLYDAGIRNDSLPVTWHEARPHTEQDLEIYRTAVELWNKRRERLDYNSLPERLKTHNHRRSFIDRFKVVASDLPFSHTVVAHISKDGHYYIHPDLKQNRSITPREAARLQTFPDDYYFESKNGIPARTPAYRQIGNAVPVLLARTLAARLKEVWF